MEIFFDVLDSLDLLDFLDLLICCNFGILDVVSREWECPRIWELHLKAEIAEFGTHLVRRLAEPQAQNYVPANQEHPSKILSGKKHIDTGCDVHNLVCLASRNNFQPNCGQELKLI